METIKITKEELQESYNTMTIQEILDRYGIGASATLYRLLDDAGIPRKEPNKGGRGKTLKRFKLSE